MFINITAGEWLETAARPPKEARTVIVVRCLTLRPWGYGTSRPSDTDLNPHERCETAGQDGGAAVGVQVAVMGTRNATLGLAGVQP